MKKIRKMFMKNFMEFHEKFHELTERVSPGKEAKLIVSDNIFE
jgi:chromosome segregation ATPase